MSNRNGVRLTWSALDLPCHWTAVLRRAGRHAQQSAGNTQPRAVHVAESGNIQDV
jgi:hypothetical protein